LGLAATASAQLLVEHEAGGLDRYTSVFSPPAAYFGFSEPTRITGFAAWVNGSVDIGATLSQVYFDDTGHRHLVDLFATSFTSTLATGVPAHWQGTTGLKWDVQPDLYRIAFDEGFYPLAYGGPVSTAPQHPFGFEYFYDGQWEPFDYPFGLRIYGQSLSAVPEPATFGAFAALVLTAFGLRKISRRNARAVTAASAA